MSKLFLLLVFIAGLISGYLIESFQGMESRKAIQKCTDIKKAILQEREAKINTLQSDLLRIEEIRTREIKEANSEFEAQSTEWEREKANLDGTLKLKSASLDKANQDIGTLNTQLQNTRGNDRKIIAQAIADKKEEAEKAQKELEGTRCLTVPVPQSVITALGEGKKGGH